MSNESRGPASHRIAEEAAEWFVEFRAGDMNCSAPISGIYSLTQAKQDRLERLSPRNALRVLLPNVLFFSSRKQDNEQLLRVLTDIVEAVPVYRLYFRRHAAFWKVIA